jgi:cephalosporin hydroxylase
MRRLLGRLRRRIRAVVNAAIRPMPSGIRPGTYRVPKEVTPLTDEQQAIVDAFHKLYYEERIEGRRSVLLSWFGHPILKCPFDIWTYQEIIFETRPELIVECGTRYGGAALFLASLLELRGGPGQVMTIDIEALAGRPVHPRIQYVLGSTLDPAIVDQVRVAAVGKRTMVILDSDHAALHVASELATYPAFVSPGCYLIVDDSDIGGHPVLPEHGPGPTEALEAWYPTQSDFVVDRSRERFMLTLNPGGFLKRVG